MSIQINITDPQDERPGVIRALALFLMQLHPENTKELEQQVFTAEELAEAESMAVSVQLPQHDPVKAFAGGKLATGAPFTAGAAPLPTAPADTPVNSTIPTPPPDSFPPVPPSGNTAAPAAAPAHNGQTSAPTVELDSAGLPWDERIHAGTRTQTANGAWKKRKGVDATTVAAVEAELRGVMGNAPLVPAADAAPVAPVPPTPPEQPATVMGFPEFALRVTTAMQSGQLPEATVMSVLQQHGFANLPFVATKPEMIPTLLAALFPAG